MDESFKRILESKAAYRLRLAHKPVAEKLRIVEQLAERALAIRESRKQSQPSPPSALSDPRERFNH